MLGAVTARGRALKPDTPLMQMADIAVTGDIFQIIPEMIRTLLYIVCVPIELLDIGIYLEFHFRPPQLFLHIR